MHSQNFCVSLQTSLAVFDSKLRVVAQFQLSFIAQTSYCFWRRTVWIQKHAKLNKQTCFWCWKNIFYFLGDNKLTRATANNTTPSTSLGKTSTTTTWRCCAQRVRNFSRAISFANELIRIARDSNHQKSTFVQTLWPHLFSSLAHQQATSQDDNHDEL